MILMFVCVYICICNCQELYARDCITVKSGKKKQDTPFIAKIGSIWRDGEGESIKTAFLVVSV